MLSEEQNCKYIVKVNILRVKCKSTMRVFSVAILAPVYAQLIRTSDWDQNLGVTLVFGLSEKTERKTNPTSTPVIRTGVYPHMPIAINPCPRYPLPKSCGQRKKQTVTDISPACLLACGDKKWSRPGCDGHVV